MEPTRIWGVLLEFLTVWDTGRRQKALDRYATVVHVHAYRSLLRSTCMYSYRAGIFSLYSYPGIPVANSVNIIVETYEWFEAVGQSILP